MCLVFFCDQSNKLQSYYLFIIVVFNVAGLWWGFSLFFPVGIWQIFPGFYRPILKLRRSNISIKWITSTWNWFVTLKIKERCKSAVQCDWCRKYVDNCFTHLCSWHTNTRFFSDQEYVKVNFCNSQCLLDANNYMRSL